MATQQLSQKSLVCPFLANGFYQNITLILPDWSNWFCNFLLGEKQTECKILFSHCITGSLWNAEKTGKTSCLRKGRKEGERKRQRWEKQLLIRSQERSVFFVLPFALSKLVSVQSPTSIFCLLARQSRFCPCFLLTCWCYVKTQKPL